MKFIKFTILCVLIFACDSENANDCFQKSGAIIREEVAVSSFDRILVNREIELILKDGPVQNIVVETGENLLNDIVVEVEDNRLVLTDNNTCNYVRDFGITKVFVTSPNITEIRSSTQYNITSNGVLTYPSLTILSEDFTEFSPFSVGDFVLEIDNDNLTTLFNGTSIARISGDTTNLNINLASGDSRFEARDLVAQNVNFFHRSSNDILVNAQQSIRGRIVSTGNIISINRPLTIVVEELFKGRLIFE